MPQIRWCRVTCNISTYTVMAEMKVITTQRFGSLAWYLLWPSSGQVIGANIYSTFIVPSSVLLPALSGDCKTYHQAVHIPGCQIPMFCHALLACYAVAQGSVPSGFLLARKMLRLLISKISFSVKMISMVNKCKNLQKSAD